jgi:hypothetical protein
MQYLVFLGALVGMSAATGQPDGKVAEKNYLIFRITTDLQREVLFGKGTRSYVVVNGNAVVDTDGTIRAKALDIGRLYLELSRGVFKNDEVRVSMRVLYKEWANEQGMDLLKYALIGAGHGPFETGAFKEVSVASVKDGPDAWKAALAAASAKSPEDSAEAGIRDGIITAYPVRTPLSRWSTNGCDCVVLIGDQRGKAPDSKVISELEKPIAAALETLKVGRTAICLQYGERPRDKEEQRKFFDANESLVKKLGFKSSRVSSY